MRIKKTYTQNEYIRSGSVLVRNFTKSNIVPTGLSHMFERSDYSLVLANEESNKKYPKISDEKIYFSKVVVVSDGYRFGEHQELITSLPKDVCVLAINGALKKWKAARNINAYVVNNPYPDCLGFLPKTYFPVCIASTRTNKMFLKKYNGSIYAYIPTPEETFGYESSADYFVDDYRNTVCACIALAHQFGVQKLLLLDCDDSFEKEKDYAVKLENGLWTYPQHLRSQEIIDANLYWLTHDKNRTVEVADCSSGAKYDYCTYISLKEVLDFFADKEDDH